MLGIFMIICIIALNYSFVRDKFIKTRIIYALFLLAAIVLLYGCKDTSDIKTEQKVHYVLDCEFDPNNHITLPVKIEDQEFKFVLDTGTGGTIVDKRLRHLFGKTIKKNASPRTINNIDLKLDVVEPAKSFSIGDEISFENLYVGVCDLSKLGPRMTEYDGIIGMVVLKEFALLLDFENSRIELTTDVNSLNLESFPCIVNTHNKNKGLCPYVTIDFNEMTEDFMVDTGLTDTTYLRQGIYDILSEGREQYPTKEAIDGPVTGKAMIINDFILGNLKYNELYFLRKRVSNIGMAFLSVHGKVAFDFKERKMYLTPAGLKKPE